MSEDRRVNFKEFLLAEAISNSNANRAAALIGAYLSKKLGTKFYQMPGLEQFKNSKASGFGIRFFYGGDKSVRFNWVSSSIDSSALDSVTIWLGKGKDPDLHLKTDSQVSLVKILPVVAEVLKAPKPGTFIFSLEDLNESYMNISDVDVIEEMFLNEGSGDPDYDEAIGYLIPNLVLKSTDVSSKTYTILKSIRDVYPTYFRKDGRSWVFQGDPEFFKKNSNEVRGKIGRIKVRVSSASGAETIKPTRAEIAIESNKERLAFETQIEDLYNLTQIVAAGASNALFVAGRGGIGKALAHGTGVLTPTGWVPVEELSVGDSVIAQDGTQSTIHGVYPQGIRKTFLVRFSDGRSAVVDGDHLWEVSVDGGSEVMTTSDIKEALKNFHCEIPLFSPVGLSPETSSQISKHYAAGVLLNKGTWFCRSYLKESCGWSPSDVDTAIDSALDIIELGLGDSVVPHDLKLSPLHQRLELTQGIVDSCDAFFSENSVHIQVANAKLADDLKELIWSLGGRADVKRVRNPKIEGGALCKESAYEIIVHHRNPRLLFKHSTLIDEVSVRKNGSNCGLPIISIEPFGEAECTCIKIDHPRSLFVIDDYVCTHNTHTVEKALGDLGKSDGNGYFKITGSSSPIGMYMTLYKNRKDIVLFDDSDSALDSQEGRNLIKAATDTKKVRKMVWMKKSSVVVDPSMIDESDEESDLIPNFFEFTGRIIFISNLSLNKLDPDGALRTRGFIVNVDPTDMEIVDFMKKICDKVELEGGLELSKADRESVIEVIRQDPKNLSLRKMVRALNIRAAMKDGPWERYVKYYA